MSAGVSIRQGHRATQASCPHACAGRHVPRPRQLEQHVGVHVLRAAGEPLTGPVRRECRMPASRTSVPRVSRTAGTTSGRPHGRAVAHRGRRGSARPMIGPTRSPAAFGIASTSTSVSILTRLHTASNSSSGNRCPRTAAGRRGAHRLPRIPMRTCRRAHGWFFSEFLDVLERDRVDRARRHRCDDSAVRCDRLHARCRVHRRSIPDRLRHASPLA